MKKVWLIYSYPYLDNEKENNIFDGQPQLRAVVLSKNLVIREISNWFDYLIYEAEQYGSEHNIIEESCRAILAEDWFTRNSIPENIGESYAAYGVSVECWEGVNEQ